MNTVEHNLLEKKKADVIESWNWWTRYTNYKNKQYSDVIQRYIYCAIRDNNTELFELIFAHLEVPNNLTLKEKICYIQLLGDV